MCYIELTMIVTSVGKEYVMAMIFMVFLSQASLLSSLFKSVGISVVTVHSAVSEISVIVPSQALYVQHTESL